MDTVNVEISGGENFVFLRACTYRKKFHHDIGMKVS